MDLVELYSVRTIIEICSHTSLDPNCGEGLSGYYDRKISIEHD